MLPFIASTFPISSEIAGSAALPGEFAVNCLSMPDGID